MLRIAENLNRIALFDNHTVFHHQNSVAILGGKPKVVRDQDAAHAAFTDQVAHQIHHRLLGRNIKARCRLVSDQQARVTSKGNRAYDPLTHAARQFERIGIVTRLCIVNLDGLKGGNRFGFSVIASGAGMVTQHIFDLVANLTDRVQRRTRVLKDHRNLSPTNIAHVSLG